MTKQKTISKLEAILDAMETEKQTVLHNYVETNLIVDRIIDYQVEYKKVTGHYYHRRVYKY